MDRLLAPIVLFAYDRRDKLERCIESLEKCPEAQYSMLYIFSDGPKEQSVNGVASVREFIKEYRTRCGFKNVIVSEREKNAGLAASITEGVTNIVNKHGKIIVVEDDLIVRPGFLAFLNGALSYYGDMPQYGSVSAYTYPIRELKGYREDVFVTRKAECWGWATWRDRWDDAKWADIDLSGYLSNRKLRWQIEKLEAGLDNLMYLQHKGKINSWAVRWIFYLYGLNRYTIYPSKSLVINDGFDGSGTHGRMSLDVNGLSSGSVQDTDEYRQNYVFKDLCVDETLADAYARYPRKGHPLYYLHTIKSMMRK